MAGQHTVAVPESMLSDWGKGFSQFDLQLREGLGDYDPRSAAVDTRLFHLIDREARNLVWFEVFPAPRDSGHDEPRSLIRYMPAPRQPKEFARQRWTAFRQIEFLLIASGGTRLELTPSPRRILRMTLSCIEKMPSVIRRITNADGQGDKAKPSTIGITRFPGTDVAMLCGKLIEPLGPFTHYAGLDVTKRFLGTQKQNQIADELFEQLALSFPSADVEAL